MGLGQVLGTNSHGFILSSKVKREGNKALGQASRLDSNPTQLDPLLLGSLIKLEVVEPTKLESCLAVLKH